MVAFTLAGSMDREASFSSIRPVFDVLIKPVSVKAHFEHDLIYQKYQCLIGLTW